MNLEQLATSSICGREPRAEAPPQAKEEEEGKVEVEGVDEEDEVDDDDEPIAGALPPPLSHNAAPTASSAAAADAATSFHRRPRRRRRGVEGSWSSTAAAGAGIFEARILVDRKCFWSERASRRVTFLAGGWLFLRNDRERPRDRDLRVCFSLLTDNTR